jgi:hypothetical protein
MKRGGLALVGLLATVAAIAHPSHAEEIDACIAAADKGQDLRDTHKLVEALEEFRKCAAASCPAVVQKGCSKWADEAEQDIPTVVLSAKDGAGNDLFDVSVLVDGTPFADKLEGVAQPIDPGAHVFRFVRRDGTVAEKQLLISEGRRNRVISATFGSPMGSSGRDRALPKTTPWRSAGWVTLGVGIAGLAIGAIFTGLTLSDKNAADCSAGGACTRYGEISSAKVTAVASGVGYVGGAVLVGSGTVLLLYPLAPREARAAAPRAKVALTPTVGRDGLRILLEGTF